MAISRCRRSIILLLVSAGFVILQPSGAAFASDEIGSGGVSVDVEIVPRADCVGPGVDCVVILPGTGADPASAVGWSFGLVALGGLVTGAVRIAERHVRHPAIFPDSESRGIRA